MFLMCSNVRAIRFGALVLSFLLYTACSDEPPAGGGGNDSGVAMMLCDDMTPCGSGFMCTGGVCEPIGGGDGGATDGSETNARIQVCTQEGCMEPLSMN